MSPRRADGRCADCPGDARPRIESSGRRSGRLVATRRRPAAPAEPPHPFSRFQRMDHEEAFMLRVKSLVVIGAIALATAACGERPVDRALTGGAIGAGGGALVGAAAGNPV